MVYEIGSIVFGKVTKLAPFGAFVTFADGKSGMIHISEVSTKFVKDIHDFLTEGQDIRAKITKIDENGRISLSIKQIMEQVPSNRSNMPPIEFTKPEQSIDFEDMMSRFKASSDDKMSDQKRREKRRG